MGSFEQARREEIERIPWLGGSEGDGTDRGVLEAGVLGAAQDAELNTLKRALLAAAGPYTCADEDLDAVGADLGIERFPGEPNGTAPNPATGLGGSGYRGRLCDAWPTWEESGTALGIIDSLKAYGIVDVQVVEDFEGHWFRGDGYSRFSVIIGPDFGTLGLLPLTAPVVPPATGGSTATAEQVSSIKRQILKWKAAHGYPVKVILRFGAAILSNINATPPCMPPDPSDWCALDVGKLAVENVNGGQFTPGGFDI